MNEQEFLDAYQRARHVVSLYEIVHSTRARWWWDPSYVTEAQQTLLDEYLDRKAPVLPEEVGCAIDASLRFRYRRLRLWLYWKGV